MLSLLVIEQFKGDRGLTTTDFFRQVSVARRLGTFCRALARDLQIPNHYYERARHRRDARVVNINHMRVPQVDISVLNAVVRVFRIFSVHQASANPQLGEHSLLHQLKAIVDRSSEPRPCGASATAVAPIYDFGAAPTTRERQPSPEVRVTRDANRKLERRMEQWRALTVKLARPSRCGFRIVHQVPAFVEALNGVDYVKIGARLVGSDAFNVRGRVPGSSPPSCVNISGRVKREPRITHLEALQRDAGKSSVGLR